MATKQVRLVVVKGGERPSEAQYALCKTINHSWDRVDNPELPAPDIGWRLSLRCIRCQSERHDLISPVTGEVMARRYVYPDGYLTPKGTGRVMRTDLRRGLFEMWKTQLRETEQIARVLTAANGNGRKRK